MKIKYAFIALMMPLFISACNKNEQPYRYACQDPANWETPQCQKPKCEVHRECPEHIFKNFEEMKGK
jgi:hypothetical protein